MARYIDRDTAIKTAIEMCVKVVGRGITQIDAVDIAQAFEDIPTADVVPKSEVERLKTEVKVLTENNITAKYPCCVSCSKGLILTKSLEDYDKLLADISANVAREIFEEIEKYYCINKFGDVYVHFDSMQEIKKKYMVEV